MRFLHMSGHRGESACHVEINHVETDDVVFRTVPRIVKFETPLSMVPVIFRLQNCDFPGPGVYYVQVFCDDKLAGEKLLLLRERGDL